MAKTATYTPEMETTMREMYLAVRGENQETRDAVVTEIVETFRSDENIEFDKDERSIRSKLARMFTDTGEQLYIRKKVVSKVTGEPAAKKSEMADTVAAAINAANPDTVEVDGEERKVPRLNPENVEKLNKTDIQAIQFFVTANTV